LPAHRATTYDTDARDRRRDMQQNETRAQKNERIAFGALMLTIVISNVAVFLFLGPYT
jgi:hypothetical protein